MPQTYTEQSTSYWGKAGKKEVTAGEKLLRRIFGWIMDLQKIGLRKRPQEDLDQEAKLQAFLTCSFILSLRPASLSNLR